MSTRAARRVATEEERALFYETLADAKPLKGRPKPAKPKKQAAAPRAAKATKPPVKAKSVVARAVAEPPEIGGHRAMHLRRGRIDPDTTIDLHGMTQDAAHRALARVLGRARTSGARVVLVITGKSGVLNKQLRAWLAQGDFGSLVSGVSSAHKRHGGAGAYYVLLKRMRA